MPVRVMVLRAAGTNCDLETEHAWRLVGASPEAVHLNRLTASPRILDAYQIVTIPGGFSYGDDVSAGRIFAAHIERALHEEIGRFVDRGGFILGICNGFQVLVKAGLLPERDRAGESRSCTITYNDPPGFRDTWVHLVGGRTPSVFVEAGRRYELPIAHGEGRVVFRADGPATDREPRVALRYAPPLDAPDAGGFNPNGSTLDIAGLCDETGRILGLMPHPERFVDYTQHPCWNSRSDSTGPDGLAIFERAVSHLL